MRQANEALERSNIELQRFAHVASHDLQTPMRSIASFVELLEATYSDKLDGQAKDWIRRTIESIGQLQTLIRDLLEYSRVDSQAHPFTQVAFAKCSIRRFRCSTHPYATPARRSLAASFPWSWETAPSWCR